MVLVLFKGENEESTEKGEAKVENIFGIGGMTRSGHLFTRPNLRGEKNNEQTREEKTVEKEKAFSKGESCSRYCGEWRK